MKPVDNTAATGVGWVHEHLLDYRYRYSEKVLSLPQAVMFSAQQLVVAMSVLACLNPRPGDGAPAPIWYMCDLCEVSSV